MPVNSNAVAVAVTGAVYRGQSGATAPTGTSGALTSYDEMGWIGEDGITRAMPGAGESTVIVGWQNGAQVRVVRAASTENPTFQFTMMETSKAVIEATYGVTLVQTATEGSYVVDTSTVRTKDKWVIHVIDGSELSRYYIAQGEVIEVSEQTLANGEVVGYTITIEAHKDSTLGGNFKVWDTRLKTP